MLVTAIIVLALFGLVLGNTPLPTQVTTRQGTVQGAVFTLNNVPFRYFKNVPFAKPPVGELRFMPPQPVEPYPGGVLDASALTQKLCLQLSASDALSEDCLYLDIYTPAHPSSDSKGYPVHVWIHGGAYVIGSKEEYPHYPLAQNGLIAVVINYRLGVPGFLRVDKDAPGTQGFLDQVEALKWIRNNIASFGGNRNLVTIQGESAGGTSVLLHLVSPLSKGLFHRAVVQSGHPSSYHPVRRDAIQTSREVSKHLGCDLFDKACLQALTPQKIVEATYFYMQDCLNARVPHYAYNNDMSFWYCGLAPEFQTEAFPFRSIYQAYRRGQINRVNTIIGTVWNEALLDSEGAYNLLRHKAAELYTENKLADSEGLYRLFLNQIVDHKSYDGDESAKEELISERAQEIYEMYPYDLSDKGMQNLYPNGYNGDKRFPLDANYIFNAIYNDKWYLCPARNTARTVERVLKDKAPAVYIFRFAQPLAANRQKYRDDYNSNPVTAVQDNFFSLNRYPTHGEEIPFFMGTGTPANEDEAKLQKRLMAVTVNFAYTGNPNRGPLSKDVGRQWQRYNSRTDPMIVLAEPDNRRNTAFKVREDYCKFWDNTGYEF